MITGSGNWHSKKDMFSVCPSCGKKGYYQSRSIFMNEELIKLKKTCKYCEINSGMVNK